MQHMKTILDHTYHTWWRRMWVTSARSNSFPWPLHSTPPNPEELLRAFAALRCCFHMVPGFFLLPHCQASGLVLEWEVRASNQHHEQEIQSAHSRYSSHLHLPISFQVTANKWYRANFSWSSKGTVRQYLTWVWFCTITVHINQV